MAANAGGTAALRTAIGIGWSGTAGTTWQDVVDYVRGAERLGVGDCWSPEAWAQDAVTPLAYLAAVTSAIRLGASVMQISARVPAMTAMTAMTLAEMSSDRFLLGLGVSGPQVVEGLHGQAFDAPITRLREHLDIVRLGLAGEPLIYSGKHYCLPLPGGAGKALRITQAPRPQIPIYLGTLGPAGLRLAGAAANGWIGTSFIPEAAPVFLEPIREGAAKVGRSMAELDIQVRGAVAFGATEQLVEQARPRVAFILGAMGPRGRNYYNLAYQRAGFGEALERVQSLWLAGRRREAAAAVPPELVMGSNFYGDDDAIVGRLRAHARAGVTTIRFDCEGATVSARLETLERVLDLVRLVNSEGLRTA
jgi:F420-dependent oxidoreductase-like protein